MLALSLYDGLLVSSNLIVIVNTLEPIATPWCPLMDSCVCAIYDDGGDEKLQKGMPTVKMDGQPVEQ